MIPILALSWPIKKIAAFFAILAALFYTLMCAAPVPAVRSMLMSGLILIAILVDRRALSMRLVAFAAIVTLIFSPSSFIDPSFQLSFMAVMALIAVFEKHEAALIKKFVYDGWFEKAKTYVLGSMLTSIVASIATMPVILYYFQQVNWYGVLTNFIAVPLSSFVIMPAGLVAVLAIPFGLEEIPLQIMHKGIEWMIDTARFVAALPGAVTYHPAMPLWGLVMVCFGLLWFCLWQRKWRFLAILPFIVGCISFLMNDRPDILLADNNVIAAVRDVDGRLIIRASSKEDFIVKNWLQRDGLSPDAWREARNWFDVAEAVGSDYLQCFAGACLYQKNQQRIGLPLNMQQAAFLCDKVDVMVQPFNGMACKGVKTIAPKDGAVFGAHFMNLKPDNIIIQTVWPQKTMRAWD
jgi:competence protein ComEC